MTDYDVNPETQVYIGTEVQSRKPKDPRLDRDAQDDLHVAIDLAYSFAAQIKELHPLAEKQIKGMIFQGNLI